MIWRKGHQFCTGCSPPLFRSTRWRVIKLRWNDRTPEKETQISQWQICAIAYKISGSYKYQRLAKPCLEYCRLVLPCSKWTFIQAFKLSKFILATFVFIISSLELYKLLCCILRIWSYEVKFQKADKPVCSRDSIRLISGKVQILYQILAWKWDCNCLRPEATHNRPSTSCFAAYLIQMFRFEQVLPLVPKVPTVRIDLLVNKYHYTLRLSLCKY